MAEQAAQNIETRRGALLKQKPTTAKRLAMFFDGTWNTPANNTNVYRLFLMLDERAKDQLQQRSFYDEGVGTHWFDRLSGGAIGWGLSENVCKGYRWLMENYDDGDEIFLFGFSRGAFTARSLAGLVSKCGLLKPDAAMSFRQLFERYQRGANATPIYELLRQRDEGKTDFDFEERVLLDHAYYHRDLIKMVGVWDTVGSLGIPLGNIPGISRRALRFHDTHLSTTVQNSYQALALDEQRQPYWAILWTYFQPTEANPATPRTDDRFIEQRWFAGSHCDVGGGYRDDLNSQRPLQWIQRKSMALGLNFRSEIQVTGQQDLAEPIHDSYSEFLGGLWKVLTLDHRHVRWVLSAPVAKPTGRVFTVNERIDRSVFDRCRLQRDYRPLSLQEWANRSGKKLETVIADDAVIEQLNCPVTKPGIEVPQSG